MASWRIRFHDKWPHLASLYASTHNLDEDGKNPDPIMGQDNVFDPSEPIGAYRYYVQPSMTRSEFSIEEPSFMGRPGFKDEESRSSDYTSGESMKRGSNWRVLLCVFLVFSFICVVVAAITLAILLSKTPTPRTGRPESVEMSARILGEEFNDKLLDNSSVEFKRLEAEVCQALREMYSTDDSPIQDFITCEVIEFQNGSIIARLRLNFVPRPASGKGVRGEQRLRQEINAFFAKMVQKEGSWQSVKWDKTFVTRVEKVGQDVDTTTSLPETDTTISVTTDIITDTVSATAAAPESTVHPETTTTVAPGTSSVETPAEISTDTTATQSTLLETTSGLPLAETAQTTLSASTEGAQETSTEATSTDASTAQQTTSAEQSTQSDTWVTDFQTDATTGFVEELTTSASTPQTTESSTVMDVETTQASMTTSSMIQDAMTTTPTISTTTITQPLDEVTSAPASESTENATISSDVLFETSESTRVSETSTEGLQSTSSAFTTSLPVDSIETTVTPSDISTERLETTYPPADVNVTSPFVNATDTPPKDFTETTTVVFDEATTTRETVTSTIAQFNDTLPTDARNATTETSVAVDVTTTVGFDSVTTTHLMSTVTPSVVSTEEITSQEPVVTSFTTSQQTVQTSQTAVEEVSSTEATVDATTLASLVDATSTVTTTTVPITASVTTTEHMSSLPVESSSVSTDDLTTGYTSITTPVISETNETATDREVIPQDDTTVTSIAQTTTTPDFQETKSVPLTTTVPSQSSSVDSGVTDTSEPTTVSVTTESVPSMSTEYYLNTTDDAYLNFTGTMYTDSNFTGDIWEELWNVTTAGVPVQEASQTSMETTTSGIYTTSIGEVQTNDTTLVTTGLITSTTESSTITSDTLSTDVSNVTDSAQADVSTVGTLVTDEANTTMTIQATEGEHTISSVHTSPSSHDLRRDNVSDENVTTPETDLMTEVTTAAAALNHTADIATEGQDFTTTETPTRSFNDSTSADSTTPNTFENVTTTSALDSNVTQTDMMETTSTPYEIIRNATETALDVITKSGTVSIEIESTTTSTATDTVETSSQFPFDMNISTTDDSFLSNTTFDIFANATEETSVTTPSFETTAELNITSDVVTEVTRMSISTVDAVNVTEGSNTTLTLESTTHTGETQTYARDVTETVTDSTTFSEVTGEPLVTDIFNDTTPVPDTTPGLDIMMNDSFTTLGSNETEVNETAGVVNLSITAVPTITPGITTGIKTSATFSANATTGEIIADQSNETTTRSSVTDPTFQTTEDFGDITTVAGLDITSATELSNTTESLNLTSPELSSFVDQGTNMTIIANETSVENATSIPDNDTPGTTSDYGMLFDNVTLNFTENLNMTGTYAPFDNQTTTDFPEFTTPSDSTDLTTTEFPRTSNKGSQATTPVFESPTTEPGANVTYSPVEFNTTEFLNGTGFNETDEGFGNMTTPDLNVTADADAVNMTSDTTHTSANESVTTQSPVSASETSLVVDTTVSGGVADSSTTAPGGVEDVNATGGGVVEELTNQTFSLVNTSDIPSYNATTEMPYWLNTTDFDRLFNDTYTFYNETSTSVPLNATLDNFNVTSLVTSSESVTEWPGSTNLATDVTETTPDTTGSVL